MASKTLSEIKDMYSTAERTKFEGLWSECDLFVKGQSHHTGDGDKTESTSKDPEIYTAYAYNLCDKLASGIFAWAFPEEAKMFKLDFGTENKAIREQGEKATKLLHKLINLSNFREEAYKVIFDAVVKGSGIHFIQEDNDSASGFDCESITPEAVAFRRGRNNKIDLVARRLNYTVNEIIKTFETVPPSVQRRLENNEMGTRFTVYHIVTKNDEGSFDSEYLFEDDDMYLTKKGGKKTFSENPYKFLFFSRRTGEDWGRSPMTENIHEFRQLNHTMKHLAIAIEMQTLPPLLYQESSINADNINFKAGGAIPFQPMMEGMMPQPLQTGADPTSMYQLIQDMKAELHKSFYIDLFQTMEGVRYATATEVSQRVSENSAILSPKTGGIQDNFVKPCVRRIYNILKRKGILESPDTDFEVQALGRIAYVTQQLENEALLSLLAFAGQIAQFAPEQAAAAIQPEVLTEYAHNLGVSEFVLSAKEVKEKMRAMQEAEEMKQQAEAFKTGSEGLQDMSGAASNLRAVRGV